MDYQVADVVDMPQFAAFSYDVVLDKGTLDALLCNDRYLTMIAKMLKECVRLLKVKGRYFYVSYGRPEDRLKHLQREFLSWVIQQHKLTYADDW